MSEQPKNVLHLTLEVPGIYCDDFYEAAEDGYTPLDCLFEGMREGVTITIHLYGDESGPELMAYNATIIDANAEPIRGADPKVSDG